MGKKTYAERNLKFETLQLHVGQEQPDPVTDARQCRFIRHLLMCSGTAIMRRPGSDLRMREIFMDV